MRKAGNIVLKLQDDYAIIDVQTNKHAGLVCFVDIEDLPRVLDGNGRWLAFIAPRSNTFYAVRKKGPCNARRQEWMHRHILGLPSCLEDPTIVDHSDLDGLNNRRSNLRKTVQYRNAGNARKSRRGHPSWKGVSYRKDRNYWRAEIRIDGKSKYLGAFKTAEEAAAAYDTAAVEGHGEFARINNIEKG